MQSKQACAEAVQDTCDDTRMARAINGEIVTDSESDNPLDYVGVRDTLSDRGKLLVKKRAVI